MANEPETTEEHHVNYLLIWAILVGALVVSLFLGTMQLLAACQKAPSVRRMVLESTTAVYGASPLDPAMFDETMAPNDLPSGGYARDATEIEGYLRGFGRRRDDVSVTVLRFANLVGPRIDTVLHEGKEIIVQIAKAPIGTKGARITSSISIPGRHLVLTPWSRRVGVSRRIGSDKERRHSSGAPAHWRSIRIRRRGRCHAGRSASRPCRGC